MAFCPYCGRQTQDGEVCSCTTKAAPQPQRPAPAPQNTQYAPTQQGGYIPQQGYAPQQPQQGYVPQQPQQGYAPQQPQQGYAPQPGGYMPQQYRAAASSIFSDLMERVKLFFSPSPNAALAKASQATDFSWAIVAAVFAIFGALAAHLIPLHMKVEGYSIAEALNEAKSYSGYGMDIPTAGDFFNAIFWLALLANVITFFIVFGVYTVTCNISKRPIAPASALNVTAVAFIPYALLNVLAVLFSFFFTAGAIICGTLGTICMIVTICVALAEQCKSNNIWKFVIAVVVIQVATALVTYLITKGVITNIGDIFGVNINDLDDLGSIF